MKNAGLFCAIMCVAASANSQRAIYLDFDSRNDLTFWTNISLPSTMIIADGTSGNALSISKQSVFRTKELKDISLKLVTFAYKSVSNDSTQFTTTVDISKNGSDWIVVARLESGSDGSYKTEAKVIDDIGYKYVRWNVGKFKDGFFHLDDIQLLPYSAQDVTSKTKEAAAADLNKAIEDQVDAINKKNQKNDATKLVADLSKTYVRNLFILQHIYDKASGIQITEKTGNLILERSKMANPSEYNEFDSWISSIDAATKGDTIIKERIADIKSQLQKPAIAKAQNVIKFIGNVGNIISGGRLSGVVNSFKDIFSNAFSKSSLSANFPSLKVLNNGKVESYTENIEAARQQIVTGLNEYKRMKSFFESIEGENETLVELARRWTEESGATGLLIEDVKKQIVNYIKLTIPTFDEKKSLQNVLTLNTIELNALELQVKAHFDSYIDKSFSGFTEAQKDQIKDITNHIVDVDQRADQYYETAQSFLNLFGDMEIDLKRSNPFSAVYFAGDRGAAGKWDEIKGNALPLATEIKELVRTSYVVYNVRYVPGY
jgi:hypothetical protein